MSPDDPRHGTSAGHQAHVAQGEEPCEPCCRARARARKLNALEVHRGVQMLYSPDQVRAVVDPWRRMGLSLGAISVAANLGCQYSSALNKTLRGENSGARRSTYQALAAVTEDDFADQAKVYGDLTRQRINSLMAAGHRLNDMPINNAGQWRHRRYVSVITARNIRAYFQAHEFKIGPDRHTESRARNAGHLPPLSWDDPGTLGWPNTEHVVVEDHPDDDIDWAVVERVLAGDFTVPTNRAERTEVVRTWATTGQSLAELARRSGWKPERYYRANGGDQETAA